MIEQQSNARVLVCTICEEMHPVYRRTAENPEALLILMENVQADHLECTKYPNDAPRAKRERRRRKIAEKAVRCLNASRFGGV